MLTIVIVFLVLTILFVVLSQVMDNPSWLYGASTCLGLMFVLGVGSAVISFYTLPDGFELVRHEYTYTLEDGTKETQTQIYYKRGDSYYEMAGMGKSLWIPFAAWDFVEVDLPESAPSAPSVETNAEVSEQQCPNCGEQCSTPFCGNCGEAVSAASDPVCPNCGNGCTTQYCGDCGTKMG